MYLVLGDALGWWGGTFLHLPIFVYVFLFDFFIFLSCFLFTPSTIVQLVMTCLVYVTGMLITTYLSLLICSEYEYG